MKNLKGVQNELVGKKIEYRQAKITPKKTGQFVSIWKRNENGITAPFDISDELDFIVVSVQQDGPHSGIFIFPKHVLAENGIITQNGKEGKRGIRVYAPWDMVENKQAEKTQKWQVQYFVEITKNEIKNAKLKKEWFYNSSLSE